MSMHEIRTQHCCLFSSHSPLPSLIFLSCPFLFWKLKPPNYTPDFLPSQTPLKPTIFYVLSVVFVLVSSPYTTSRQAQPRQRRPFRSPWHQTSWMFTTARGPSWQSTPGHLILTVLQTNAAPVPWASLFLNKQRSFLQHLFSETPPLYGTFQCLAPGRHPQLSRLLKAFSHERSFLQSSQSVRVISTETGINSNLSQNIWPSS